MDMLLKLKEHYQRMIDNTKGDDGVSAGVRLGMKAAIDYINLYIDAYFHEMSTNYPKEALSGKK